MNEFWDTSLDSPLHQPLPAAERIGVRGAPVKLNSVMCSLFTPIYSYCDGFSGSPVFVPVVPFSKPGISSLR